MRAAIAQMPVARADVAANLTTAIEAIVQAAQRGADLVLLTECALTGYVFDSRAELAQAAVALDGPEIVALAEACAARGMHAIIGTFERAGEKLHNTAVLLGPDGVIGAYRKAHLPFLGGDRFVDLPEGVQQAVFDTAIGKIGIAICYEIRFPEVARTLMLDGAEVIALPTNWPAQSTILPDHFAVVRAAENMVYFLAANRADTEGATRFAGKSQIVDPLGQVVVDAGQESGLFIADLDLARTRDKRIVVEDGKFELNLIRDRRPQAYRI